MKSILCLAAGLLAAAPAFAGGGFILRGGLNIASANFDPSPPSEIEVGSRIGGEFGLLFDGSLTDRVGLVTGLLYENKGHTLTEDYYGDEETATFKLDYLTIPYMFSFRSAPTVTGQQPGKRFFLSVGGEFSFLLESEAESDGGSFNMEDITSGTDLGLRAEAGVEIPMAASGNTFILGLGYSRSLSNFVDQEGSDLEGKNYAIKLFAALKFGGMSSKAAAPAADPDSGFP